ncbi:DUF2884 family protein [Pseudoalteromonas sp. G4]|uniref:DUF2884 family protein n=1 Tax=Pseudoalteromonas sp. G4 TaxID=2992761 RepID=UPI00237DF5D7|nr:DUF2884 family protein [Pseudoalteromonas sp. G4]MDE3273377.1 YggN family protein [Pseudoalteromonas sp. G4]
MKKLLITTAVAACMGLSASAMAHQDDHDNNINFSSDSCNLKFNNKLSITPDTLNIEAPSGVVAIDQDGNLKINGESQSLSASDQTLLARYSEDVRGQVPQVAEIAMEGVALAGVALSEVGNAFGLENMSAMEEIMSEIGEEIQHAFYDGGTFVMDQGRFDNIGDTFDNKFDEKMEQAMEEMMMESIGSLLITLGSEMLSSGGNMSDFEQRMERMGEQIEEKVELQAKNIEQKADKMCFDFKELAMQEDELQARIPALANYDVFKVETKKSSI